VADIEPLRALHYDPARAGDLDDLVSPPYDVIDAADRARLLERSPHNVVEIDLPRVDDGEDPYAHAASTLTTWLDQGILVRDEEPALWALSQDYTGPDGRARRRHGFFARVRVENYGAGRIRPHERTHPGPKEDRLRLTRATQANLSPIFALYDDPDNTAWNAIAPHTDGTPFGDVSDPDGTRHRLWRVGDEAAVEAVHRVMESRELLIADGHHRYETARVYAEEIGGEGAHRYVLMYLVSLEDPGLEIFPTHRLLVGLDQQRRDALHDELERDWEIAAIDPQELQPTGDGPVRAGYLERGRARMLSLRDQSIADAALPEHAEPYRRLDTAVLEALVLQGALNMTEDDISHLNGLDYARSTEEARARVDTGEADAAFFMRSTPVEHVREVAAAGETMPPKSTYFFPKVLTGLLFNPLTDSPPTMPA
jgi:uncharacterized protein (DUF1015 family)